MMQDISALRTLDRYFGEWLVQQFGFEFCAEDQSKLCRIAQAVSYATFLKHTCLDLDIYEALGDVTLISLLQGITRDDALRLVTKKIQPLRISDEGSCIWLQKYHGFEWGLYNHLKKKLSHRSIVDETQLQLLKTFFSDDSEEQRQAAEKALEQGLTIITGGPGTGKTWTVARIIVSLLLSNPECKILLAAPTGKAGARMKQALDNAFIHDQYLQRYSDLLELLPEKASTIEGLLGINYHYSPKPSKNSGNLLNCDVLIVDETSMISAPSMYRLLDALPETAKLILLGDKDQLSSVEAGSVLAELCSSSELEQAVAVITRSRRFDEHSEIGNLAKALNSGEEGSMDSGDVVRWHSLSVNDEWQPGWLDSVVEVYKAQLQLLKPGVKIHEILQLITRFQILSAMREGPQGVHGINAIVEKALGQDGGSWYIGKPVMITRNDHDRKLYNGDVGMVLPVAEDGETVGDGNSPLKACFLLPSAVKSISLAQMPAHETCYAMTIHKSQGSEYERVLIILPTDFHKVMSNPVLTRELIYTGVTRATTAIDIWSGVNVLNALSRKVTVRMSGFKKCNIEQKFF